MAISVYYRRRLATVDAIESMLRDYPATRTPDRLRKLCWHTLEELRRMEPDMPGCLLCSGERPVNELADNEICTMCGKAGTAVSA